MLIFPRAEVQEGLTSLLRFVGCRCRGAPGAETPLPPHPGCAPAGHGSPPPAHSLTGNSSSFLSIHDYIVTLGFAQLLQSTLGHATCPSLQQHYGG